MFIFVTGSILKEKAQEVMAEAFPHAFVLQTFWWGEKKMNKDEENSASFWLYINFLFDFLINFINFNELI